MKPAWGPLARDMDSVVLTAKIMLDGEAANKIDPLVAPLPFNEEVSFILVLTKFVFSYIL